MKKYSSCRSAFFNPRAIFGVLLLFAAFLLAVCAIFPGASDAGSATESKSSPSWFTRVTATARSSSQNFIGVIARSFHIQSAGVHNGGGAGVARSIGELPVQAAAQSLPAAAFDATGSAPAAGVAEAVSVVETIP